MPKRDIIYGNHIFNQLESSYELTYWNLWILLLLHYKFNDNWDDLISTIKNTGSNHYRYNAESMISHIYKLRKHLSSTNISSTDLTKDIDIITIKKQLIKAKRKVLELGFQDKEKSLWMQQTPRAILFEKALKGNPNALPVNIDKYIKEIRTKFKKKSGYSEDQAYDLSEKLSKYIEKNEKLPTTELSAFYRGFLSVILEKMDYIDDSYGQIGMLSSEVFNKYIGIYWRDLSVDFKSYFDDLIKYVIWDGYCITDSSYSSLFSGLTDTETKEIKLMLQEEQELLQKYSLNYESEKAKKLIRHL